MVSFGSQISTAKYQNHFRGKQSICHDDSPVCSVFLYKAPSFSKPRLLLETQDVSRSGTWHKVLFKAIKDQVCRPALFSPGFWHRWFILREGYKGLTIWFTVQGWLIWSLRWLCTSSYYCLWHYNCFSQTTQQLYFECKTSCECLHDL